MRRVNLAVRDKQGITHKVYVYPDAHSLGRTACALRYVRSNSQRKGMDLITSQKDVITAYYTSRAVDCVGCLAEEGIL